MNRLLPLIHVQVNSSAASITIECAGCNKKEKYGPAEETCWTFDPNGKPFHDYYCPSCSNQIRRTYPH